VITESGVRARSNNPRSRGPAPDLSRAQLPPLSTRRPRPARQPSEVAWVSAKPRNKHFIARGWAAVHADLSVFARALVIPVSSGDTTATRLTCGSSSRTTSQQLPVTSNTTRSDATKLSASDSIPSGVAGTRRRSASLRPRRSRSHRTCDAHPARSRDRPIGACPRLAPPQLAVDNAGEPAGQRHRPIRALSVAQSRQVAGAAERKARARSPSIKTAYPSAFSQTKAPVPDQPNLRPTPDGPQPCSFMPREATVSSASSAIFSCCCL
jgi:hypothetical protein